MLAAPLFCAQVAFAQDAAPSDPAPAAPPAPTDAAPAVPATAANGATIYDLPDPASLKLPELSFKPTPEMEADFDKYFFFHRDGTSFPEAFADIKECDALASGSNIYMGADSSAMSAAMAQYGLAAGAIGGVIGGAIADAIFGSAARRQQRRINLRNCMGFKGYGRYGLSGDLWKEFNFEEGHGRKKEGVRDEALELQALVASGPKPQAKELGL
jgi:hypothetical protein